MIEKIIFQGGLLAGAGILITSINWHSQFKVFSLEKLFCKTIRKNLETETAKSVNWNCAK